MRHVKLLPAMPTGEKLLPSSCVDGVVLSDRWCQPRKGFSVGSLQLQEGCKGDAQQWAQGWDGFARSCHQPRSQLLKYREAAAAWEKRLKVMAQWPAWTWLMLSELLPWDGCDCLPRDSQSRQVRGFLWEGVRCKDHPHSLNKCHELLTSAMSSREKCNSLFF